MENRKFKYLLSPFFYIDRGLSRYYAGELLYDNRKEVGLSYQLSLSLISILKSKGLDMRGIALKEKRCYEIAEKLSAEEFKALLESIELDKKNLRIDVNHYLLLFYHKQIELEKEPKKQR